ncbi:hypothetical protein KC19_VG142700 [Ceratodon purpureus]|uniref:Uncharacterized protein n=1 Tax=Ceratodon purpureus TaxID=3225 RepID=A0A8T0HQF5_CERPU|nr:hypothetical protein KC19_VG142700 [Ceratodon purpureus]
MVDLFLLLSGQFFLWIASSSSSNSYRQTQAQVGDGISRTNFTASHLGELEPNSVFTNAGELA